MFPPKQIRWAGALGMYAYMSDLPVAVLDSVVQHYNRSVALYSFDVALGRYDCSRAKCPARIRPTHKDGVSALYFCETCGNELSLTAVVREAPEPGEPSPLAGFVPS